MPQGSDEELAFDCTSYRVVGDNNLNFVNVFIRVCGFVVGVHLGRLFQSARDMSFRDASCEGTISVAAATSITIVIEAGGGGPRASFTPWRGSS